MKKIIPFDYVIIIGLVLIALIALNSFLKSDKHISKIAEKSKYENIEEHNSIPRYLLTQGVYSFDYYADKVVTEKDKFDEYHEYSGL